MNAAEDVPYVEGVVQKVQTTLSTKPNVQTAIRITPLFKEQTTYTRQTDRQTEKVNLGGEI